MRNLLRRRGLALLLPASLTIALAIAVGPDTATESRLAALPLEVPAPADNPTTPERVSLGRLLFWDPILSGQGDVACATCHHPDFGYSDGLNLSIGANGIGLGTSRTFAPGHPSRLVKRNSQTVLNAAFNGVTTGVRATPAAAPMFWDLRVRSLEAQALEPIKALEEMRGDAGTQDHAVAAAVARVQALPEYRRLFAAAFGGGAPISANNLGRALAAFERTLVAVNAPFDRYMRGERSAMTAEEIRGMERFQSAGCINCHSGPMFSDFKAHVLGVPDARRAVRFDAAGSSASSDSSGSGDRSDSIDSGVNRTFAFRTASLRNLGATAPYMHNGTFRTLPQVLDFYRRISRGGRGGGRGPRGDRGGGRFVQGVRSLDTQAGRDQIDPLVRRLNLRGGQRDIIAFLRALDDPQFDRTVPDRVPSGLPVGGRIVR